MKNLTDIEKRQVHKIREHLKEHGKLNEIQAKIKFSIEPYQLYYLIINISDLDTVLNYKEYAGRNIMEFSIPEFDRNKYNVTNEHLF